MTANPIASLSTSAQRRLIIGAGFALLFESALYSALAPLLPHYVDDLGLSKAEAGLLTADYTLGVVIGAVAAGALSDRIGPRRTAMSGFALLGVSTVAFGFAQHIVALNGFRLIQGLAAGTIWAGVMAWLITTIPAKRRGEAIGAAMSGALIGTLLGPVIGLVGVAVGDALTFGVVGAASIVGGAWILRLPRPAVVEPMTKVRISSAFSSRQFRMIFLLAFPPGLMMGLINVLIPLRLDDAGAATAMVGGTFIAMGLLTAALSPVIGRRSDRVGERPLMVAGLGVSFTALVLLVLIHNMWGLAILVVILGGVGLALFSVPTAALLSRVSGSVGLTAGATAAVMNLSFAGAETLGALVSGGVANATSDAAPLLGMAGITLAALLTVSFTRIVPQPAPATTLVESDGAAEAPA